MTEESWWQICMLLLLLVAPTARCQVVCVAGRCSLPVVLALLGMLTLLQQLQLLFLAVAGYDIAGKRELAMVQ